MPGDAETGGSLPATLRGLAAAALLAVVAAMGAALALGDAGAQVVEMPAEPGEAVTDRLADGTPVVVGRGEEGAIHVLDARADRDGRVTPLVAACEGKAILVGGVAGGAWALDGRPLVPDLNLEELGAEAPPGLEAQEPLTPFEVEAVSGDVASVGEPATPETEADPVVVDQLDAARCPTERMRVHDAIASRRALGDLADAGDGRRAVDAVVEQHGGGAPRLCPRPAEIGLDGDRWRDGRGLLPACDGDGVALEGGELATGGLSVPTGQFAVARAGIVEVVVRDGRVAQVAVPADLPVLGGPTGGEIELVGTLAGPVARPPAEVAVARPVVPPSPHGSDGGEPPGRGILLRRLDEPSGPEPSGPRRGAVAQLWLADDAELALPDGEPVDADALHAALAGGALDAVAYDAAVDLVSGATVRLVPAQGHDGEVAVTGVLRPPALDRPPRADELVPPPLPDEPYDARPEPDLQLEAPGEVAGAGAGEPPPRPTPIGLWLADDAEVVLPGGGPVGPEALLTALETGELGDVRYEAVIDELSGKAVRLVPADA